MLKKILGSLLLSFFFLNFAQYTPAAVEMDFDGDGKTDPTVYNGTTIASQVFQFNWFSLRTKEGFFGAPWGAGDLNSGGFADFLVPGDYDGDGRTDLAVWRRPIENPVSQSGLQCYFYIFYTGTGTFSVIAWGRSPNLSFTDIPVPQDYDGDGKTDVAIARSDPTGKYWWILQSRDGVRMEKFDNPNGDVVRGDYDGDGKADIGVARASDDTANAVYNFFIKKSSNGQMLTATLGKVLPDILAPGDYDGDGKTDIAVWSGRTVEFSTGFWKYIRSSDGQLVSIKWGHPRPDGDSAQGDYDGDGKTDIAVYHRNTFGDCNVPSYFWINGSSSGVQVIQFGSCHGVIEWY